MKRIVLCADDAGHGPSVDAGILRLLDLGRLGAVSCQVAAPGWPAAARALRRRAAEVDLGLHLDLAPGRGGLAALLARSALRALDRRDVAARIAAQLDAFERDLGAPPAFVDGHQHVHQLPVVRDLLLAALAARYPAPGPRVRCTVPRRPRGAKSLLLAALGGAALARALRRRGIGHNRDFAGVYGLGPGADYRRLFRGWLAGIADGALLMCHPGRAPGDPGDPIAAARAAELAYLESPDLDADCAAAGVERVRFGSI